MIHFIRPWFLAGLLPTLLLIFYVFKISKESALSPWAKVCDPILLSHLMKKEAQPFMQNQALWLLLIALCLIFVSASGPAFKRLPQTTSVALHPKVILLDLSPHMLVEDVSPNRLARAKFAIYDLLNLHYLAPIGMLVYTKEPFIVSPLTEDAQTISALLPTLDTDTPPVSGQNLNEALLAAEKLIHEAHFQFGAMLVLTGSAPSTKAIETAGLLAKKGFNLSILPLMQTVPSDAFKAFAQQGGGLVLSLPNQATDLKRWVKFANQQHYQTGFARIPEWQDEGLWFLIPVLFLLLPAFRRGYLYA